MKKILIILTMAIIGFGQMVAQDDYTPFVREGVKWVYYSFSYMDYPGYPIPDGTVLYTLELKGDTIIDGKTYKAMHKYSGDSINETNDTIPVYLREDNKIVYGIVPDGKTYPYCPVICGDYQFSQLIAGEEFILYDFNDPVAFNYAISYYYQQSVAQGYNPYRFNDMITVNGHQAKRYVFSLSYGFGDYCFIEGIGFDGLINGYTLAFLFDRFPDNPSICLSHVIEDGKVIYCSEREVDFRSYESYLPIVRPDVTWVYEHVTISGGDTTCYYYTYNFKPVGDPHGNYYCYYSCQDVTNHCVDSLVALGDNRNHINTYFINNKMLKPLKENEENLIDFESSGTDNFLLYSFHKSHISSYCLPNYYIEHQKGDLLNYENFTEVEPIEIEGISCSRYAYVKENGDTMCYVVEGIGFDSRNMGDLLTPFTREPDPDADYQEYCGLCHVVKDGQIIYKGMRYDPGNMTGIDEVVAEKPRARQVDDNYYNLMGQPVGKTLPTAPGIYIHHGKKIVVR